MSDKMERFSKQARMSLDLAQKAARQHKRREIAPERLLIGLMKTKGSVSQLVLDNLGLREKDIRGAILCKTPDDGYENHPLNHITLADKTIQLLETSVDEARRLKHHYIGTEHLLLGLLCVDSVALNVLRDFEVSPEQVEKQIYYTLIWSSLMPRKIERFTKVSRRVLYLAQDEVTRLSRRVIKPEHMLIGLIQEDGGVAANILRSAGLDAEAVQLFLLETEEKQEHRAEGEFELTNGTKKVLALSVAVAGQASHHNVSTGHLLIGLIQLEDAQVISVFQHFDVNSEEVTRQTRRMLKDSYKKQKRKQKAFEGNFLEECLSLLDQFKRR